MAMLEKVYEAQRKADIKRANAIARPETEDVQQIVTAVDPASISSGHMSWAKAMFEYEEREKIQKEARGRVQEVFSGDVHKTIDELDKLIEHNLRMLDVAKQEHGFCSDMVADITMQLKCLYFTQLFLKRPSTNQMAAIHDCIKRRSSPHVAVDEARYALVGAVMKDVKSKLECEPEDLPF